MKIHFFSGDEFYMYASFDNGMILFLDEVLEELDCHKTSFKTLHYSSSNYPGLNNLIQIMRNDKNDYIHKIFTMPTLFNGSEIPDVLLVELTKPFSIV